LAIHPSGTFDYVGTVGAASAFPWTVELRTTRPPGHAFVDGLAGPHPHLVVEEAGMTPNPGQDGDTWRPAVLRARLSVATGRWWLVSRTVTYFHLDLALAKALQPGDLIHLSRTGCGGTGVSAVRDGRLVFAVGAIRAVPLGDSGTARVPWELVEEAEAAFRDPGFQLSELPLEIVLDGQRLVTLRGARNVGSYEVTVFSGFRRGVPGDDESAAISRRGLCSGTGANASAQLLAAGERHL
jgi:hypothetical protein